MPESLPSRATISVENKLIDVSGGVVLSATSEAPLLPKERLLDPHRSRLTRTASASVQQQWAFQFPAPVSRTNLLIALINSNLDDTATVRVEMSTLPSFPNTTDTFYWDFTTYAQGRRRVLRWYPGAKDGGSGTDTVARSFARITFPASHSLDSDGDGTDDPYYQLGVPWFGTYLELPFDPGMERKVQDPSQIARSAGGALFAQRRRPFHQIAMESSAMPEAESQALIAAIEGAGLSRHIMVDLWASSSDAAKKADGCYYATLADDTIQRIRRRIELRDNLSHEFIEARA